MQLELLRKRQAVRIASTRQEEFSPQSTATLERLREQNMGPEDFEKSIWFRKDQMHVMAPEGVSTCRSKKTPKENR